VELPEPSLDATIGLYDVDGRLVAGRGPSQADATVRGALAGDVSDRSTDEEVVVAVPVAREEQVVGAVRASESRDAVSGSTRRALLLMALLGAATIGVAALVALAVSRRLARPIEELSRSAERLGGGDFTPTGSPSGVPEIDAAREALEVTATRIRDMLERERAFAADASHQLRTPLAALRLDLEAAARRDEHESTRALAAQALAQVERLEGTIETILEFARDLPRERTTVEVASLLGAVERDWRGRFAADARPLRIEHEDGAAGVPISESAARETLNVLLENALLHGSGAVTVVARPTGSAIALDVRDEGGGVSDPSRLFVRRSASAAGTGIGLALARSLAESEGGRLLYDDSASQTTFTLLLPGPPRYSDSNR
jgi:signal transduction histidine kinase